MDQLTLTLHKTKDTKNKVTAKLPRKHQGRARRGESARDAERRGRVDVALLSVLRDGLLRRSEAAELRWGDLELQEDGSARLHVRRSKTVRRQRVWSCTSARRPPRPCRRSCPRIQPSWTPPGGSLSSPPAAGGSMLQPRLRAWARVSLATRGGSAKSHWTGNRSARGWAGWKILTPEEVSTGQDGQSYCGRCEKPFEPLLAETYCPVCIAFA